jgi:PD-(D/E)XK nuclease superfamily
MLKIPDEHPDKLLHRAATEAIIGAAFEVHDELGYGFLERVYQRALQVELVRRGATAELHLIVNDCVLVEIKVAPQYDKRDEAQLLNELKATGTKVGMLVNFGRGKVEYKRLVF